jgi:hypothetical protein
MYPDVSDKAVAYGLTRKMADIKVLSNDARGQNVLCNGPKTNLQ